MTSRLMALCFAAHDPVGLARFWAGMLGRRTVDDGSGAVVLPPGDDTELRLRFVPSGEQKVGQNRMHLDLTSTTADDQRRTVARAFELGACHIDVGQRPEEGHVVLADPEGNELCVIGPGNSFLAGCGFVGAIACDGSQEVGYFWSEPLGWPLVWDQDEETTIQSSQGGTKITWGGPPVAPKRGKNRPHFDLAPVDGDLSTEADRLVALGATRPDIGQGNVGWVVLADPDGNELCLKPA